MSDSQVLFHTFNRYSDEKAIYARGDNRQNLYENIPEKIKEQAKSVACLIELSEYFTKSNQGYTLHERSLNNRLKGNSANLPNVNFGTEPSLGFGSAFLVGKDLVLTAGHCVCKAGTNELNTNLIKNTRLVFGFQMTSANEWVKAISKDRVYKFEVVSHKNEGDKGDWALLKLTQEVKLKALPRPLEVDFTKIVGDNHKLYMLGHPYGLPLKLADEGESKKVNNTSEQRLEAEIVAYQGNSGSPVFCKISHKVIGILVGGHKDFDFNGQGIQDHLVTSDEIKEKGYEKCQRTSAIVKEIVAQIDVSQIDNIKSIDQEHDKLVNQLNELNGLNQLISLPSNIKEGLELLGKKGFLPAFITLWQAILRFEPENKEAAEKYRQMGEGLIDISNVYVEKGGSHIVAKRGEGTINNHNLYVGDKGTAGYVVYDGKISAANNKIEGTSLIASSNPKDNINADNSTIKGVQKIGSNNDSAKKLEQDILNMF